MHTDNLQVTQRERDHRSGACAPFASFTEQRTPWTGKWKAVNVNVSVNGPRLPVPSRKCMVHAGGGGFVPFDLSLEGWIVQYSGEHCSDAQVTGPGATADL